MVNQTMKAHRSKNDSRNVTRQEKNSSKDSSSASTMTAQTESTSSDYSSDYGGVFYRPGSLVDNVSRTLQQNSRSATRTKGTRIHPQMQISQPQDQDEQEAEAMAEKVIQQIESPESVQPEMETNVEQVSAENIQPIRRESALHRQSTDDGGMEASPEVEAAIDQETGKGMPLQSNIREPMEEAFGVDFSHVRIHTDSNAQALNDAIEAEAFTTEQDIFFNQGAYNPSSTDGKHLLAHELTHVIQQTG